MATVERQKNCLSPNSDFKLDLSEMIENLKGGEMHSFLSIQNEFETDKQNYSTTNTISSITRKEADYREQQHPRTHSFESGANHQGGCGV